MINSQLIGFLLPELLVLPLKTWRCPYWRCRTKPTNETSSVALFPHLTGFNRYNSNADHVTGYSRLVPHSTFRRATTPTSTRSSNTITSNISPRRGARRRSWQRRLRSSRVYQLQHQLSLLPIPTLVLCHMYIGGRLGHFVIHDVISQDLTTLARCVPSVALTP